MTRLVVMCKACDRSSAWIKSFLPKAHIVHCAEPQYKIRRDVSEVRANVHFASTLAVAELVLSATANQQQQHSPRRPRPHGGGAGANLRQFHAHDSDSRRTPVTLGEVPAEDDLYPSRFSARRVPRGGRQRSSSALADYGVVVEEVVEDGSKQPFTPTSMVSATWH